MIPKDNDKHIGIEIEFYAIKDRTYCKRVLKQYLKS